MGTTKAGDQNDQTFEEALTGLRLTWGGRYEITEAAGGFRASRIGGPSTLLVAEDPWSLRIAIIRDFSEATHPR